MVVAPPQFTFICPLSKLKSLPPNAKEFPPANCIIDHSNDAEKNKLHLYIATGLEADTRYAFLIDVVNGPYVNPTTNYFTLTTLDNSVPVETATVPGFSLAEPMMNTRYVSTEFEDRRVDWHSNQVTFILGTTQDMPPGSMLEFRAPEQFTFPERCEVGVADYVEVSSRGEFPEDAQCYGYERVAQVKLDTEFRLGIYGLYVVVQNPTFTPLQTNWGIYVYNPSGEAVMAEAWIQGFPIQEILDPHIEPYNPAKAIPGEAAPNPIDIWFSITTELSGGSIQVQAPPGFHFPQVCRYFFLSVDRDDVDNVLPLPTGTECSADGKQTLTISLPTNSLFEAFSTFGFRVLVEDPSVPFNDAESEDRLWTIATYDNDGNVVDRNYKVVGFPVRDRLRYFSVQTLSGVGLRRTTIKISFNLFFDLMPQKQVIFISPKEFDFLKGRAGRGCADAVGTDQEKQALRAKFGQPLFSDISQLPEYIRCSILSKTEVGLLNTDNERGGRLLFAGPTYEVLVTEVNNPQSTPELNLYRAIAHTGDATEDEYFGPERWAYEGFPIFPELADTSVESQNPAFGLYTTFTFALRTITRIPPGGSLKVTAPQKDYYFGPRIDSGVAYDELESIPPPSGNTVPRPPPEEVIICEARTPPGTMCPFDFVACVELQDAQLKMVQDPTIKIDTIDMDRECEVFRYECDEQDYSNILSCESKANILEITLTKRAFVPGGAMMLLTVAGYNTNEIVERDQLNNGDWHYVTRNADSVKTPLDEKMVPGFSLAGVIFVSLIEPALSSVTVADNEVSVVIRLSTEIATYGKLRITYPSQFALDTGGDRRVSTGEGFRRVQTDHTGNVVEIVSSDDALLRDTSLYFSIFMSNPGISPPPEENIWQFETIDMTKKQRVDCNFDAPGFKIYGDFRQAKVAASILAPAVHNIIGILFVLESELRYSDRSYLRIWLPPGYTVESDCGLEDFKLGYEPPANAKEVFPAEKTYYELPSGSSCEAHYHDGEGLYYVLLKIDAMLEYGLDYAFQFGVTNAPLPEPPAYLNVFRFETLMDDVILHLKRNIPAFTLEQLKVFEITPYDTTSHLAMSKLEFLIQSDKNIPGGSKIEIYAPRGFIFTCAYFRTTGLAMTTTCYTKNALAVFTVDTQDGKTPMAKLGITAYARNPKFTPQPNMWAIEILSPLGSSVDTKDNVPGFDITGSIVTRVMSSFPFKGQRNPIAIEFIPATIMNQADPGNHIVITAPMGFRFPANCTGFVFKFSNEALLDQRYPNKDQYRFPPPNTLCYGNDAEVLTVRLPDGAGLLAPYNYTIEANVMNPRYDLNDTKWSILTRVVNPEIGMRIVDANRSFDGFFLRELQTIADDISGTHVFLLAMMLARFI
jgi:hypothetical protein